LNEQSNF
jgi:hypothetical protein